MSSPRQVINIDPYTEILKGESILRVNVINKFVAYRGCIVESKTKPGIKGIIFEINETPKIQVLVCWFDGTSQRFDLKQLGNECVVTGVMI